MRGREERRLEGRGGERRNNRWSEKGRKILYHFEL